MLTKVITAHVPIDLAEKVYEAAARLERSRGWIVKQALEEWVDSVEARRQMTLEALADVDANRLIDQESVLAWAQSLSTPKPLPVPQD